MKSALHGPICASTWGTSGPFATSGTLHAARKTTPPSSFAELNRNNLISKILPSKKIRRLPLRCNARNPNQLGKTRQKLRLELEDSPQDGALATRAALPMRSGKDPRTALHGSGDTRPRRS